MTDDNRITRVGRVLRTYSIDELPQLFNVVAGTMALVGPRPALAREVAHYCPMAARRLAAKPGLTGLWQVSGRRDLTWDESIRLDARYVDTWTPTLDAKILARTAGDVLRGGHEEDAYEHLRSGHECGVCGAARCRSFRMRTGRRARSSAHR